MSESACRHHVNLGTSLWRRGISGGLKRSSVNYPGDRKAESVNGFTGRLAYHLFPRLMKDYDLLRI